MRVDVASQANFEAAFEKCLDLYESIDVVVNNAGVEGEINWETQLETNFNVSIVKWSSFQFHAEMYLCRPSPRLAKEFLPRAEA